MTLRASCDIKGLHVKEAKIKADSIVSEVLALLPSSIKVHGSSISSAHNAFMNHPTAKHNVTVEIDGRKRLISDNSHGVSEFEAVDPEYFEPDSVHLERFNEDIISKPYDLPSVLTYKVNVVFTAMENFSVNMNRHVAVMEKIEQAIDNLNHAVEKLGSIQSDGYTHIHRESSDIQKSERLKRAENLRKEWGW